jgi:hypothetical protein
MWSPLPDAHVRLVLASDATLVRADKCPSLRCVLPAAPRLPRKATRNPLALKQNVINLAMAMAHPQLA